MSTDRVAPVNHVVNLHDGHNVVVVVVNAIVDDTKVPTRRVSVSQLIVHMHIDCVSEA